MILTFRPIKTWPEGWQDPRRTRSSSPFRATHGDTLQLLDREFRHLGATSVTLQVDATERDCRLDGQLRADAKVRHPGVILTIETKKFGTLVYPCDAFTGGYWGSRRLDGWQANLRAIALGLEALRKVERYGIAERGQQYAGYRELPSGIAMGTAKLTVEDAARFIAEQAWPGDQIDEQEVIDDLDTAYRAAAKRLHPDAGGDPASFRKLTEARDLLEAASG